MKVTIKRGNAYGYEVEIHNKALRKIAREIVVENGGPDESNAYIQEFADVCGFINSGLVHGLLTADDLIEDIAAGYDITFDADGFAVGALFGYGVNDDKRWRNAFFPHSHLYVIKVGGRHFDVCPSCMKDVMTRKRKVRKAVNDAVALIRKEHPDFTITAKVERVIISHDVVVPFVCDMCGKIS